MKTIKLKPNTRTFFCAENLGSGVLFYIFIAHLFLLGCKFPFKMIMSSNFSSRNPLSVSWIFSYEMGAEVRA